MSQKLSPRQQAAAFRRVLKLAGGRQSHLVAALGCFPQHVNNWKTRGFSREACERIAALYNIAPDTLRPDLFGADAGATDCSEATADHG